MSYIPVIGLEIHAELLTNSNVTQNSVEVQTLDAARFVLVCQVLYQSSIKQQYNML